MEIQPRTITLRRAGQFLQMSPPCVKFDSTLSVANYAPQALGNSVVLGAVSEKLYRQSTDLDEPVIDCFAGLQPAVEKSLIAAGYEIQRDFTAPASLDPPDLEQVSQQGPCDLGVLNLVQIHDRALIRYAPAGTDPAWLIAQIVLAWPKLTIAVAVTRISDARQLRRQLLRYLPNVAVVTSKDSVADEQVGRVVVATYNGLGHTGIEIEKRDIVIVLNAVEASRVEPLSRLGYAHRARMYGLLPLGNQLAPFDKDVIRLLFGFEEVTVHKHGIPARQIEIVRLYNAGGSRLPQKISFTELKRQGIWHNTPRNRRIAWLAKQLKGNNRSGIQQSYPVLAGALRGRSALAVLVLVENIEHGNVLAKMLPGWPLFVSGQQLPVVTQGNYDAQRSGSLPSDTPTEKAIATWQGVPTLNECGWDVVIIADGSAGLPPFVEYITGYSILYGINSRPGQALPIAKPGTGTPIVYPIKDLPDETNPANFPLVVIDVHDRHHQILRRWSRQRREAFAERGCYAPDVDPVQARIDRFLATRPK